MALLPTRVQALDVWLAEEPVPLLFKLVGLSTLYEGLDAGLLLSYAKALGDPVTLYDLALISTESYVATASGLQPSLSPLALGKYVLAQKWAFRILGMGLCPGRVGPAPARIVSPHATASAAALPPFTGSVQNHVTKMSPIFGEPWGKRVTMILQSQLSQLLLRLRIGVREVSV